MSVSRIDARSAVLRAVGDAARPSRLADLDGEDRILDASFEQLGFSSLSYLEFCIAIHLATRIDITADAVAVLGSPRRVLDHLAAPP